MERASRLLDPKLGLDGDDPGIRNFIAQVTIPPQRFNAMKQCSVVLYLPSSLPLSKIESGGYSVLSYHVKLHVLEPSFSEKP